MVSNLPQTTVNNLRITKHPKSIRCEKIPIFLSLSVSFYHSSLGSLFWGMPLWANFLCLVIIFCRWHGDIKHSDVFSWEQPCCDQGNKLNIRRQEAVCQRWEWQVRCREGCACCLLQVSDGWQRRCCQSYWNIKKTQKTEMIEAPTSQWKMNTALPEDETTSQLWAGMFELGIRLPEHCTEVGFVCSQNVSPVDKCHP